MGCATTAGSGGAIAGVPHGTRGDERKDGPTRGPERLFAPLLEGEAKRGPRRGGPVEHRQGGDVDKRRQRGCGSHDGARGGNRRLRRFRHAHHGHTLNRAQPTLARHAGQAREKRSEEQQQFQAKPCVTRW